MNTRLPVITPEMVTLYAKDKVVKKYQFNTLLMTLKQFQNQVIHEMTLITDEDIISIYNDYRGMRHEPS